MSGSSWVGTQTGFGPTIYLAMAIWIPKLGSHDFRRIAEHLQISTTVKVYVLK